MGIKLPYGKGTLELEPGALPVLGVVRSRIDELEAGDGGALVREALGNPIGSPQLRELAKRAQNIVVITSDHTRPVPSRVTMPLILDEIRAGRPDADITVLIATGMHRASTQDELSARFGPDTLNGCAVVMHDCTDDGAMVHLGRLPSGVELYVSRIAAEADLLVAEGFIEPHFFAGFSGGRKAVLPGVCSRRSVMENHCAELVGHEKARAGVLKDNPIHADMVAGARMCGLKFIVNVVIDANKDIVRCFAGDTEHAHERGCEFLRQYATVKPVMGDIVVSTNGGYPLDQDIYQSVKGMTGAEACVNPGGVIIMLSECIGGHGGERFVRYFTGGRSPADVERDILAVEPGDTQPDQWQAQILARVMRRARVIMVSHPMNEGTIRGMGMGYAPTLADALLRARGIKPDANGVVVVPDGVGVIY